LRRRSIRSRLSPLPEALAGAPPSWRGVGVYLALAFGLSWAAQIALSLALRGGPQTLASLGAGILVAALFLMWPPAIGAFVARRWVEAGSPRRTVAGGFTDGGLRWPAWRYVALAWLGPAALTLLTAVASLPLYPFDPAFAPLRELAERSGRPLPAAPEVVAIVQLAFALTLAVPINSLFALGEELGWRGYLLPRLMALRGPWSGLLLHGAIWGFWHAPLIVLTGYNYPRHQLLGVGLFVVSGALMGVLLGWLQLASRSVISPTIAHGALNAIGGAPLLVLRGVDPAVGGVVYSPIGWVVLALAIALLWRSGTLDRALQPWRRPHATSA
jgi:membrane protease YdiL (CAAX protease family)